jgi:ABC-type phosphate transport system substrate-binding protein
VAAVDGIPATAWVAAEARATLTVNLGRPAQVGKITVARGSSDPFPYSVEISSDGEHWKTVATAPAKAGGSGAGTDEMKFAQVEAKFVRLVFAGADGSKPPSIAEFSVASNAD